MQHEECCAGLVAAEGPDKAATRHDLIAAGLIAANAVEPIAVAVMAVIVMPATTFAPSRRPWAWRRCQRKTSAVDSAAIAARAIMDLRNMPPWACLLIWVNFEKKFAGLFVLFQCSPPISFNCEI